MVKTIVLMIVLLAAASAANAVDKALLINHIAESYAFPSDVKVTLSDPKPSDIPGFDLMTLTMERGGQSQAEVVYISKDGKHYQLGPFKDITFHPDQERLKKMEQNPSPVRGNPKAAVTVVEYTDFQCPYCQVGFQVMRDRVMKEYPNQVKWIYKSLPLKQIHPWADPAAVAAACAFKQSSEKFWSMHDNFFEKQRDISFRNIDDKVAEFAKAAGVDQNAFNACYKGRETEGMIERDMAEAEGFGVNGTPAFFVNGHQAGGGADYDGIKNLIERALKKRGS